MILNWIMLVSGIQVLLYLVLDSFNFKYGRLFVFLATLAGHFFVFPPYFYPEPNPDRINCGMPVFGITLAFWIIGGGAAAVVHLIYILIRKKIKAKVQTESNVLDEFHNKL